MMRMTAMLVSGVVAGVATLGVTGTAQEATPLAHRFIKVADGVYAAVGNGTIQTQDTVAVVINRDDVLVVDTNITPEATRRLVNDIKTLTDKPIRYVVNTHWHYDHTDGNQIFGPDVRIIGHENTRKTILAGVLHKRLEQAFRDLPNALANTRKRLAAEQDPAAKKQIERQLAVQEAYQEQLKETVPTPPNTTLTDRLTIFSGDREIQIFHPGRGHSDTDVIVYLPREKVIMTGDFWEGDRTGALNFGFHDEWADNLEKLKALDFEHVIAGHGDPFKGKETIDYFQAFLRDLWQQAKALHAQKVPVAEAAKRIDMTAHKAHFDNFTAPGIPQATAARLYQVLDQQR
jgi:glyoxylase-like metal-dependent hydrolase (beta-lactamase superfamily II)